MIKNLIFDLGGVVINIDFDRSVRAFASLGIENFQNLFHRTIQLDLFAKYEIGAYTDNEFRNELRTLCGTQVDDHTLDKAWNAMLLDFPSSRLQLLQDLKKRFNIYLLSNTNNIHYQAFQQQLKTQHGINGLEEIFHKTYFSHQIQLRKPDSQAYQIILKEHDFNPQETLFIDDAPQNIGGAQKVGLQTLWINTNNNADILHYFNSDGKIEGFETIHD
jgi:putative hydrolase of the HAD superfamily